MQGKEFSPGGFRWGLWWDQGQRVASLSCSSQVDYDAFLQRLLLHPRMEAGSPGQVPQHQVGTAESH